jgi:excisionase family DNA binding protein
MAWVYDLDYLTVQEAASTLGVSARSVYGYIAKGQLPATRLEGRMLVKAQDVAAFELTPAGRQRERSPFWHAAPELNHLSVTIIKVGVRPGGDALLEGKLAEFQAGRKHCLVGTSARYIGRSQCDPGQIDILLFWRKATMPSEQAQKASLCAFYADLAEVVEWETAVVEEICVLLHAV